MAQNVAAPREARVKQVAIASMRKEREQRLEIARPVTRGGLILEGLGCWRRGDAAPEKVRGMLAPEINDAGSRVGQHAGGLTPGTKPQIGWGSGPRVTRGPGR